MTYGYLSESPQNDSYSASFDNENTAHFVLPLSPTEKDHMDSHICRKFIRHLRHVPSSRMTVKILASIQYTADMLDCSDSLIAKVLVDYGLRAPRAAFPEGFLKHVDSSFQYEPMSIAAASWSYKALHDHWYGIGDVAMPYPCYYGHMSDADLFDMKSV